jgi:alginate O-acetyltransferase complex protein AlgI
VILGLSALLLLLAGFKSAGWMAREFFARGDGSDPATMIILPLGLSYYIFKMLGYLLDVYWELMPAQRSFAAVALHSAFFPQLVSGPIQRAGSFFEQLQRLDAPDPKEFLTGLRRILFGLFKKVVIADTLATVSQHAHAHPALFSPLELLAAAYCFAIQLYMDFSGLTDIAIGLGLLFGIRGPENFDLPFFAPNIQVFWRRTHMSLTTWLTDYLFTPLRMSFRRLGTTGLCLAIFINLTAIGLWHGLTWTFLIYGAIHGVYMIVSVLTMKRRNAFFHDRPALAQLRKFIAPIATFHLVVFTYIFFGRRAFPPRRNTSRD